MRADNRYEYNGVGFGRMIVKAEKCKAIVIRHLHPLAPLEEEASSSFKSSTPVFSSPYRRDCKFAAAETLILLPTLLLPSCRNVRPSPSFHTKEAGI